MQIICTCLIEALHTAIHSKRGIILQTLIEEKRVVTTENGKELGEMTFVKSNDDEFYTINHTTVHEEARGRGIGQEMVKNFVEFARNNGKKIEPLCTFAKAQFDKNPDYADVLK